MLKSLLSVCSICVLLLPTVFLPTRTIACPVDLPETLLSLYRNSDAIYVARFDKVEDHEIIENTDERIVLNIKKHFDISSTLKGEPQKLFVLDEQEYRDKPRAQEAEDESEDADEEEGADEGDEEEENPYRAASLVSGDLLLLFLKKGEDGKTLELTDYRDGIKKMTRERLDSYEARIRDLNSIFSAKKVDNAAIVDWIVRCAQDPATRWEGAFELQQSFQQLEWLEEQKREEEKEEPEEQAETIDADANDGGISKSTDLEISVARINQLQYLDPIDVKEAEEDTEIQTEDAEAEDLGAGDAGEVDNSVYARMLTDTQKQTLMNVLLERRPAPETDKDRLSAGDKVLIDVVSNWGDNRFASYLLDRLQTASDDGYFVHDLMSTISRVLADDELEKIASKYSDVYYQDEDELLETDESVESADDSDTEKSAESGDDTDAAKSAEPAVLANPAIVKPETSAEAVAPEKKVTYKELRRELLTKFIDRGLVAIQIANSRESDSTSR